MTHPPEPIPAAELEALKRDAVEAIRAAGVEPWTDADIEPIPDLTLGLHGPGCPECGHGVERVADRGFPLNDWRADSDGWRCDHCRITWTPDGTGGEQTS